MPALSLAPLLAALARPLALLVALSAGVVATQARALSPDQTMALCRDAAIAAADRNGVPREVMLAITQVETRTKSGGRSGPWPWTVNVAGRGAWFESRAAALLHAQQALESGEKSFDVGCFQLNYRWHGEHFPSVDAMFEPGPSGDYAARFLKELYAETGDWMLASGNYHSRTPVHATRYRNLVANTIRRMGDSATEPLRLAAAAGCLSRLGRAVAAARQSGLSAGRPRVRRKPADRRHPGPHAARRRADRRLGYDPARSDARGPGPALTSGRVPGSRRGSAARPRVAIRCADRAKAGQLTCANRVNLYECGSGMRCWSPSPPCWP